MLKFIKMKQHEGYLLYYSLLYYAFNSDLFNNSMGLCGNFTDHFPGKYVIFLRMGI